MSNTPGAIYTPSDITKLLTDWAIRSAKDKILDLGVGEGAFVYACHKRLAALGAPVGQIEKQIYGTEIDEASFNTFKAQAAKKGLHFPGLKRQDFFQAQLPQVDAIVGNPPYIRRMRISPERIDEIRKSVISTNCNVNEKDLSRLTDLYVYFLLKAFPLLKPDGKLAVVVADSWLNVRYGRILKNNLKKHFEIEQILKFDRSIFPNAQVKPVLLLATKKEKPSPKFQVAFTKVMNGLAVETLSELFQNQKSLPKDVETHYIFAKELDENKSWGIYFKISNIINLLKNANPLAPIAQVARTRIGLQTLAKDFFTLKAIELKKAGIEGIEPEFLEPFAYSVAQFNAWIIDENTHPELNLFFCNKTLSDLAGTQAKQYILSGESREVQIRGKKQTVIGYHSKKRIQQARRPHWYDLKTEVERRGRAQILIPRIIYKDYRALWNKALFVPGESTIEFMPYNDSDIQVYLAVLNSTLMEVLIRGYAQMYGGGANTVGLAQIKSIPIIDASQLDSDTKNNLAKAYQTLVKSNNRQTIDELIWDILGVNGSLFETAVQKLRLMTVSAKKKTPLSFNF